MTLVSLLLSLSAISASGTSKAIEVPFEFYRNQIIVHAAVNGQGPYNMLLDTGTDPSAIDLATARAIGLKLPATGHPVSGGGTQPNPGFETKLPVVTLGAL